jgi:hypothetical protein
MAHIVEVVIVIHIVDIEVVVVGPIVQPGVAVLNPISAVLEALVSATAAASSTLHVEGVVTSEAGSKAIIRNATSAACGLPSGVLATVSGLDAIAIFALCLISLLIACTTITILPIAVSIGLVLFSWFFLRRFLFVSVLLALRREFQSLADCQRMGYIDVAEGLPDPSSVP